MDKITIHRKYQSQLVFPNLTKVYPHLREYSFDEEYFLFNGNSGKGKLRVQLKYFDSQTELFISGSWRNFFAQGNRTRFDLRKRHFRAVARTIAEELNIPIEELYSFQISYLEIGCNVVLPPEFKDLPKCFVGYSTRERTPFETTAGFYGETFTLQVYDKLEEVLNPSPLRGKISKVASRAKLHILACWKQKMAVHRFECKAKPSKVPWLKDFTTLRAVLENWGQAGEIVQERFRKVYFINRLDEQELSFENVSPRELSNKLDVYAMRGIGIERLFNSIDQFSGKNNAKRKRDKVDQYNAETNNPEEYKEFVFQAIKERFSQLGMD